MIEKVISGGQTGADRGGLDAAIYAGVPHGGWCPKGRLAEDGEIPAKYQLQEMGSKDYIKRTEANVVDSDVTIIFGYDRPTRGSKRTIEFCEKHGKPSLHVDLRRHDEQGAIDYIIAWLHALSSPSPSASLCDASLSSLVLNIAGSRESNHYGLRETVERIIVNVLHATNHTGKIMYPQGREGLIGSGDPRYRKDDGADTPPYSVGPKPPDRKPKKDD